MLVTEDAYQLQLSTLIVCAETWLWDLYLEILGIFKAVVNFIPMGTW